MVERGETSPAERQDVPRREGWAVRVELEATRTRAVFTVAELRTVALEQAAGHGLHPDQALDQLDDLRAHGRVIDLADDRMTTATVRAAEQRIETSLARLANDPGRVIDHTAIETGIATVEQRLGSPLSVEQRQAVAQLTAPARAALLIGPAGTGKGVVIDAAAHAEHAAGREVYGLAVAGRTAQRLGESAPALAGRVHTIDGFVNAVDQRRLALDARTTVYLDEAGMGDTDRLDRLTALVQERGGSLVAIGDPRQLPSIGAGGMFTRLAAQLPTVELSEVRRARDQPSRDAWQALRDGDPAEAVEHYRQSGAVHLEDTREQAIEAAAHSYDRHAQALGHERVALMTDASNLEIDTSTSASKRCA